MTISSESIYEKINPERVAVLIGPHASVKKQIEKSGNVKIKVNSENGDIQIISKEGNGYDLYQATQVVKAIGAGFHPAKAQQLFKDNYYLVIVDLKDWLKDNKEIRRQKARLIGMNGRTRRVLEQETQCQLSIYGNLVGIIGPPDGVQDAEKAVEMVLNRAMHKTVYAFLEKQNKRRNLAKTRAVLEL